MYENNSGAAAFACSAGPAPASEQGKGRHDA